VRRFLSKREILRRLEAVEAQLRQPTPPSLEGQQAIDIPDSDPEDANPEPRQQTLWP